MLRFVACSFLRSLTGIGAPLPFCGVSLQQLHSSELASALDMGRDCGSLDPVAISTPRLR
jgi:hypothetical protein